MKRTELIVSAILVPVDFIMLVLAAWLAHRTRFLQVVEDIRPVLYDISVISYLQTAALVAGIWILIFALYGLYNRKTTDSWFDEIGKIIAACSAGLVAVVLLVFLQRELFSSRFIILLAYVLAIIFVAFGRLLIRNLAKKFFTHGYGAHRVVVVGECQESDRLSDVLKTRPELGYRLVARIPVSSDGLSELDKLAQKDLIDEVHFVEPSASRDLRILFHSKAERYHLTFRYAPDLLISPIGNPSVDLDAGVPLIEVPETKLTGWGNIVKRIFDILVSITALLVLSPVIIVVAFFVVLETGMPVIFKSQRVGRGKQFAMYKFRSMFLKDCIGSEYGGKKAEDYYNHLITTQSGRDGLIPKIENDPRITKVGYWIRKYSLDELPQLWNVLKGDMSLVGPRPHLPSEVSRYDAHHHKVLAIKPGITGLAQVNGRSDINFEEEVQLDRFYIEQWSFWLDLKVLLRTIPAVLKPPKQEK